MGAFETSVTIYNSTRLYIPADLNFLHGGGKNDTGITERRVLKLCTVIKRVKWSLYRPGVAQRVGRGIALLFHDHDTRRGWVVSSTPWPHFTPGKDPVPILQEAGCPGPVWMGRKSRPHRDSIPDRPAHSQSLCRMSYLAHEQKHVGDNKL